MATVTEDGVLVSAGVQKAFRPIDKGSLKTVKGIIVHQTDSSTAKSTLNGYMVAGNGAHFLIDKDGTIYQTASVFKKTWHVGKLKAKCMETHTCTAAEVKAGRGSPTATNRLEMRKDVPDRFPSNEDSIGIEIVSLCVLDPKYIRPSMTPDAINTLRGAKGVFEAVTRDQNDALRRLIAELQSVLSIPEDQVFTHPRVSAKNPTEASTADIRRGR